MTVQSLPLQSAESDEESILFYHNFIDNVERSSTNSFERSISHHIYVCQGISISFFLRLLISADVRISLSLFLCLISNTNMNIQQNSTHYQESHNSKGIIEHIKLASIKRIMILPPSMRRHRHSNVEKSNKIKVVYKNLRNKN